MWFLNHVFCLFPKGNNNFKNTPQIFSFLFFQFFLCLTDSEWGGVGEGGGIPEVELFCFPPHFLSHI